MPRVLPVVAVLLLGLTQACGEQPSSQRWYYTCGDPVCRQYTPPEGVPACTTQAEGGMCAAEGTSCDPHDVCNRVLTCATHDPRTQPGGCPISHASVKRDIRYLDAAEVDQRYAELRALRLATYRYRDASPTSPERLGFIIDDRPPAVCVRQDGDTVDLYGYTSLTAAAVQAQARRIDALERELADLRAQLKERPAASR
jgi:hypothetical protein